MRQNSMAAGVAEGLTESEAKEQVRSTVDSRNEFPVDGERWMWRRLFAEEDIEGRFAHNSLDEVEGRDDIRWSEKAVEDYFRSVRRFKEEMAVLVHLTAGSPARAIEFDQYLDREGLEGRGQRCIRRAWSGGVHQRRTTRDAVRAKSPRSFSDTSRTGSVSWWYIACGCWFSGSNNCSTGSTSKSSTVRAYGNPKPRRTWKDREDEDENDDADNGDQGINLNDNEWSEDEANKPTPLWIGVTHTRPSSGRAHLIMASGRRWVTHTTIDHRRSDSRKTLFLSSPDKVCTCRTR